MSQLEPVTGPASLRPLPSTTATPLEQDRALARVTARMGQPSAVRADSGAGSSPAVTFSARLAASPVLAGTPAEAGLKGLVVSVKV